MNVYASSELFDALILSNLSSHVTARGMSNEFKIGIIILLDINISFSSLLKQFVT